MNDEEKKIEAEKKAAEEAKAKKEEDAAGDSENGTDGEAAEKSKGKSIVDEAREERILIEKAREDLKAENDRTEKLAAEKEFGGQSKMSDGENKKEETPKEYKDRVLRGK